MSKITPPVIILGMHRSGTSCLAGSLQQAGLVLGDVHTANPWNKKGNREHPGLMALHEAVLAANDGSWHAPPETVQWTEEHCRRREAFLEGFAKVDPWGFKDPRALILIDGWLERFPDARLVGTIRHPLSVAESLHRRQQDLHTIEGYMALWAQYNERLLALWHERQFQIVDFDQDDVDYLSALSQAIRRLGLGEGFLSRVRRLGLLDAVKGRPAGDEPPFFDPALRSHRRRGDEGLPGEVARLYRQLKEVAL